MKSVRILTLGCRVNQYDSQVLRELAHRAGFSVAQDGDPASWVVVNSCTVTAASDAEVRRLIRRARRTDPGVRIALVGCLAQRGPKVRSKGCSLDVLDAGADLVLGNRDKFRVFDILCNLGNGTRNVGAPLMAPEGSMNRTPTKDAQGAETTSMLPEPSGGGDNSFHWPLPITTFLGHRRPILKVQDGCRFRCSFCAVPAVRGGSVSRPKAAILEEARGLAGSGAREVVLTGVQLSSYGLDLGLRRGQPRLAPVVKALLKIPGIRRVRLSSYGVSDFEEGLLDLIGEEEGLCPHFHLPLQSGDEGVLRSMKRPYTLEGFRQTVDVLKRRIPGVGITTDIIAGFPGETEAAFRNTLRRLEEFGFRDIHPFPYSRRPGTVAESLIPAVPDGTVRERMEKLLAVKRRMLRATAGAMRGRTVRVIVEGHSPTHFGGTTPEGLRVFFPRGREVPGEELCVKVAGFQKGQIRAVRVE